MDSNIKEAPPLNFNLYTMPNRNHNVIEIKWPEKEIKKFRKYLIINKKETSLFRNLFPTPKELLDYVSPPRKEWEETDKDFERRIKRFEKEYWAKDWYEWNYKNWWTKWDISGWYIDNEEKNLISFQCDTPRWPPESWLVLLSDKFPKLKIKLWYDEPGMWFSGEITFHKWGVIDYEHYNDAYYWEWQACSKCWCMEHKDNLDEEWRCSFCQ